MNKYFMFSLLLLMVVAKKSWSQGTILTDTALTTLKAGAWSDPTVWSGFRVPGTNDSIVLQHDVVVDINANCKALVLNGKNFTVNSGAIFNINGYKPVINESAVLIDSSKLKLISTAAEIDNGIYKYLLTGQAPNFKTGDAIVGDLGDGYIRKVTSIAQQDNILTLNTTQGSMEDIFKKAHFGFGIDVSDLDQNGATGGKAATANKVQQNGNYSFTVPPKKLLSYASSFIELTGGNFTLSPNMAYDWDYGLSGLNSFEMTCKQAKLDGVVNLSMYVSAVSAERVDTLVRRGKTVRMLIGGWPVIMKMDFFLISTLNFKYTDDITYQKDFTITTNNNFDLGIKYDQGSWNNSFNINASTLKFEPSATEIDSKPKMEFGLSFKPLFKIRFYGIIAPYVMFPINAALIGRLSRPANDWDLHFKTWADAGIGADVRIFGKDIYDFGPKIWSTDTVHLRTPFKILKDSGDFQSSADTIAYLPKPIRVKVVSEPGFKQPFVPVYFKIISGRGSITESTVVTDSDGFAETLWRIGGDDSEQILEVRVKNGAGSDISESPIYFSAKYGIDSLRVIKLFNQANTPVFTSNFFKSIGIAKGGYIYAGTNNQGFYKCVDSVWSKLTILTNNNISDMQTDQYGGLWISQYGASGAQATNGGVNYLPDSTQTGFMYYGGTLGSPTRNVRGAFVDTSRTNGNLRPRIWTACMADITAGVSKTGAIGLGMNAASPYFNRITNGVDIALQAGSVQVIGGNSEEVWAFASNNFGQNQLLRYNAATGAFIGPYDYLNTTVTGLTNSFVARSIYFDLEGRKWVGLQSGGVIVKEGESWTNLNMSEIFPPGVAASTNAISGGSFGKIYIGTSMGLVIYNGGELSNVGSFKRLTIANGLPSNNVLDVIERKEDGLLIVSTDAGIVFMK